MFDSWCKHFDSSNVVLNECGRNISDKHILNGENKEMQRELRFPHFTQVDKIYLTKD